jgi:hypothetical protein
LLNRRHPGWESSPELVAAFLTKAEGDRRFQKIYEHEDVILFQK